MLRSASVLLSSAAWAQDKIKVGVTATLEGTYTLLGEDGVRGFKVALKHYGGKIGDNASDLGVKVGDKELEFVIASTDATPDSAVRAVRKLIDQDHAQILSRRCPATRASRSRTSRGPTRK